MPVSLGEFLHRLATTKAGMSPDDEKLKNFLLNGELMKIELPEEIEKGIDNQLISIKDAKNNHQEIKNWYQKQTLDGVDNTISSILDEEADEELKTLITGTRSSYAKIPLLVKAIKDRETKKVNLAKPNQAEIQKEIDRLHSELKLAQDATENIKKEARASVKNIELRYAIDKKITPLKTIFDQLDPEVKGTSIKTILDKELQDNKAKWEIDERGVLVLQKDDGTSYYGDNHQLITPESFIEKALSRNKLLITTSQAPGPQGDNTNRVQPQTANGTSTKNPILSGLAQQSLNDYKQAESARNA